MPIILAGDLGGTKTLLQATQQTDGGSRVLFDRELDSRAFPDFASALSDFLQQAGLATVDRACFAVAGPIQGDRVSMTNLAWEIDARALESQLGIGSVRLINDFEGIALGIDALGSKDLVTLQAGTPIAGAPRVVLGAGTGMGVAWLVWQGEHYVPLATEAGHLDFGPANDLQAGLLNHLQHKHGHVSWERVVSGPGLVEIFRFLQTGVGDGSGLELVDVDQESGARRITELALQHKHPIAIKALQLFVECYGAFAGNLALAGLTRGGVYVAGGIAPKIIEKLKSGAFISAFCDKGRYAALLRQIPVRVVMNPKVGLLGAARGAGEST
ncbi:MAG: glucokinase [Betaproteobacteria bacterium]|nr:glucokinase [Betaproteobacteria bacterium]